jgi:hypothetical protein
MAAIPPTWGTYSVSITIDPSLAGQVLQIGFANTAANYNPSGVFYDNLSFTYYVPTPVKSTTWGQIKGLYR